MNFYFLTAWLCVKWIRKFEFFVFTHITHGVDWFQGFEFVVWNKFDRFLELKADQALLMSLAHASLTRVANKIKGENFAYIKRGLVILIVNNYYNWQNNYQY